MNLSLSFLTFSYYLNKSHFLMENQYSKHRLVNFQNIHANSFFSNFFKSKKLNSQQIAFNSIYFSKFLDTPISIENDNDNNNKNIFKKQFSPKCDHKIIIENSKFIDCKTEGNGGAILINCESSTTIVKDSEFLHCISIKENCGAISFSTMKSVAIFSTCFINCTALKQYQTFYAEVASKMALNLTGFHFCGFKAYEEAPESTNYFLNTMSMKGGIHKVSFCNFSRNYVNGECSAFSSRYPNKGLFQYFNIENNYGGYAFERYGIADNDENISFANILNHNAEDVGTMHLLIFSKMCNFVFRNVTIDPFIYGETSSIIIMEDSIFDVPLIKLRILSPEGIATSIFRTTNCPFSIPKPTPILFEQQSTLMCIEPEPIQQPNFIERISNFCVNNPHIIGLFFCIILAIMAIAAYFYSQNMIEKPRIPIVLQRNQKIL